MNVIAHSKDEKIKSVTAEFNVLEYLLFIKAINWFVATYKGNDVDVELAKRMKLDGRAKVIEEVEQETHVKGTETHACVCEDAISRQDAINAVKHAWSKDIEPTQFLEIMPPVKSMRKRGKWIETAEEYYKAVNEKGGGVDENTPYFVDDIACSECLSKFSVIDNESERFDFCPACGSDNKEDGE